MQVIVKPILSEKMTALTDKQNRVAFVVSKAANKLEMRIKIPQGATMKCSLAVFKFLRA